MGKIINDIVEDVQVKPSKAKLVLKWTVRIAVGLIGIAFIVGQLKIKSLNKINDFEKALDDNTKATIELKQEMTDGFNSVNKRIDKVYDDGFKTFNDFQKYNDKKLELIIDYGKTDKEVLKKMLEIMTLEKTQNVENEIQQARKDTFSIMVKPINKK
jgi:hypothetical protein